MRRADPNPHDDSQDSFLDVVANVVGILVILVMLVGMRATNSTRTSADPSATQKTNAQSIANKAPRLPKRLANLRQEYTTALNEASQAQKEVAQMAGRIHALASATHHEQQQRAKLAYHRAVVQSDLEERKNKLDSVRQQEYEVQRQLVESQLKLETLTQERLRLLATPDEVEQIECIPTPVAKAIDDRSIFLRLKHGKLSIVPVQQLKQALETEREGILRQAKASPQSHYILGPVDGYRLKIEFLQVESRAPVVGPQIGRQLGEKIIPVMTFLPTTDDLGQHAEQALLPGAVVYEYLKTHQHTATSVSLALYDDSFSELRILKKSLLALKLPLAIKNLPTNAPIAFSALGTNPSAQ